MDASGDRAVEPTLSDFTNQLQLLGDRQGGLRRGRTTGSARGIKFDRLSYVPGVQVSGLLTWLTLEGKLQIGGRSAASRPSPVRRRPLWQRDPQSR